MPQSNFHILISAYPRPSYGHIAYFKCSILDEQKSKVEIIESVQFVQQVLDKFKRKLEFGRSNQLFSRTIMLNYLLPRIATFGGF